MRYKQFFSLLLISSSVLATAPMHETGAQGRPPEPPFSIDRAAMNHVLSAALAQRSGRPQQEITAMLLQSPPPEVAQQLGLDREAARGVLSSARDTVIQKALSAGLIDQADVQQLQRAEQQRHAQRREAGEPKQQRSTARSGGW